MLQLSAQIGLSNPNDTVDQRLTYAMSDVYPVTTADTYDVGLCATANAAWNSNDTVTHTAFVVDSTP
jgi:hypothetical protein